LAPAILGGLRWKAGGAALRPPAQKQGEQRGKGEPAQSATEMGAQGAPSLLALSIDALARALAAGHAPPATHSGAAAIPEPELAARVLAAYERRRGGGGGVMGGAAWPPQAAAHLRALRFFAPHARPRRVQLSVAAADAGPAAADFAASQLPRIGAELGHLELAAPRLRSLAWAAAPSLAGLSCLSLRGCAELPAPALAALAGLPRLAALDLAGLAQLGDDAAPYLLPLTALQARVAASFLLALRGGRCRRLPPP
jgi:hypothetical protein